jgi:hypothetical protein
MREREREREREGPKSYRYKSFMGAAGDGACFPRAAVSGGFRLCLLCRLLCFLVFYALCCCYPLVSMYSLTVYYLDFIRIFVG